MSLKEKPKKKVEFLFPKRCPKMHIPPWCVLGSCITRIFSSTSYARLSPATCWAYKGHVSLIMIEFSFACAYGLQLNQTVGSEASLVSVTNQDARILVTFGVADANCIFAQKYPYTMSYFTVHDYPKEPFCSVREAE